MKNFLTSKIKNLTALNYPYKIEKNKFGELI